MCIQKIFLRCCQFVKTGKEVFIMKISSGTLSLSLSLPPPLLPPFPPFFFSSYLTPFLSLSLTPSPLHCSSLSLSLSLSLFHSRVIVESTSNSDWSCELVNIKKSFLKLKPLINSLRGAGIYYLHTYYILQLHYIIYT